MLALDSRTKSKLGLAATLLAPIIVVQVVRTFFGASAMPTSASAAAIPYADPAAPTSTVADRPLTPAQVKALAWTRSRQINIPIRSPMLERETFPQIAPDHEWNEQARDGSQTTADPQPEPSPSFTITGMIAGENHAGSLTTINHRVYRIGDQIIKGWTITAIDTRRRVVLVVGPEGQSIEVPMPPLSLP